MNRFSFSPGRRAMLTWLLLLVVLLGLTIMVSPVSADAPIVVPLEFTASVTIPANTGVCPFDVELVGVLDGYARYFIDRDGNDTHFQYHFFEQDTFSANGKTLVGDRFANVQQGYFDENGDLVHVYEVGVIEKVRLPDGKGAMFFSAGRVDFLAQEAEYVLLPDVGRSGDLDAFCAALSP